MKRIPTTVLRTALLFAACSLASAATGAAAPEQSRPGVEAPIPLADPSRAPDSTNRSVTAAAAESPAPSASDAATGQAIAGASSSPASPSDQAREARITAWISELSRQAEFAGWANASHRTDILGPGTHSWLVTVVKDGKDAGYLVVTYAPDGELGLAEYGSGPYPLFSLTTLHRILAQRGLVLLSDSPDSSDAVRLMYLGPLESYWIVNTGEETLYLDAKSGERLPVIGEEIAPATPSVSTDGTAPLPNEDEAQATLKTEWRTSQAPIDPLQGTEWMRPAAHALLVPAAADLLPILRKQPIGFAISLYNGQCLYPFAVSGLHLWSDGTAYVAVDQYGSRYIPWTLAERGIFYPVQSR